MSTHVFGPDPYSALSETTRELGYKQYEISNHLGNVLSVITDQKLPEEAAGVIVSYSAVIITATDYSPFGVGLYGRSWSEGYRYGFQGQEEDQEMWEGSVSYKYRVEDARLGRFFSVDPLIAKYPFYSAYSFSGNRTVDSFEMEGLEPIRQPQGRQGVDYWPVTEGTARSLQAQVDAGKPILSRPFQCPDGGCINFQYFLLRPKINVSTETIVSPPPVTIPVGPPTITNQNAQINFNPDTPVFAAGAVGQVNAVAAQAQTTTATIAIGDPSTTRTLTKTINGENLTTKTFTDVTTQQVQTTVTSSVITVAFSTILPDNPANRALTNARFTAVSTQLQTQGIAAGNIVQGAMNFGVAPATLPNGNQVNFNISTSTSVGLGTQTTTTTTTEAQTFQY
jgi:RHS repeat-associated protein